MAIIAFNISCSRNKMQNRYEPDLLNEAVDSIGYSLFVDSIKYVNLETSDSCLIGKITDLVISNEYIFVFDKKRQTIWRFNRDGRFLNKIFRQGNGPGEYTNIEQFEYDEKNNQIVVLAWGKRLMYYTSEGEYLKTLQLDISGNDFKIIPQGGFIISRAGLDDNTAGVYYVNNSGKGEKLLVGRNNNHMVYMNFDWELCSYDSTICFMAPNFKNTVYHFNNNELMEKYPFCMKPELKHDYKETVSMQYFEDFVRTEYLESERWILSSYWSSIDDLRVFLFSKRDERYWIGKSMVNDVDDIQNGTKVSMCGNNTFVTWVDNEDADENPVVQILYLK